MGTVSRGWALVAIQGALLLVLVLMPRRELAPWPFAVGGVVALCGIALLVTAFVGLGDALTPTPVPIPEAGLRTTGAYSRVRHPIYGAVLLISLGWLIAAGSGWTAMIWMLLVAFFWSKARWEDALLSRSYGDQWSAWAHRTGRLLPRLRR